MFYGKYKCFISSGLICLTCKLLATAFCKENSISTDTIIMLDMNEYARPFTSIKLNNGKDGKAEPIIELV